MKSMSKRSRFGLIFFIILIYLARSCMSLAMLLSYSLPPKKIICFNAKRNQSKPLSPSQQMRCPTDEMLER